MSSTTDANERMDLVDGYGEELAHAPLLASMDALAATIPGDETVLCTHCGMPVGGDATSSDDVYIPCEASRFMAALVRGISDVNIEDEPPATMVAPPWWSGRPMHPRFRTIYYEEKKHLCCFPQCMLYKHCSAPYQHDHASLAGSLAVACSVPLCATFVHEYALGDTQAFGFFHRSDMAMDALPSSLTPAELTVASSKWIVGDVEHHRNTKTSVLFQSYPEKKTSWLLPDGFMHSHGAQEVKYTFCVLLYVKVGDLYELVAYQDSPEFAVHSCARNSKRKPTATLAEKNAKRPRLANAVTSA
ncbi:hypothetical protein SDRG_10811 [Saprolegnia diclina VS20]|uniref:Uncharacterized protein n=1 Tax=Saprolegnia diclina (strain VS20) TaxID=1156394 RepID=T0QAE7_SAPDV|nr:hypothetical protein SDRG_10811 [Saprolegnia diclina VS20]EQC31646.1 hypothetical protein SDRG_10811 [Saprolegnia diclina VS20]|eukprot:XP_008615045.1 hypothetical protein SDRG_10811 [Saprolegnia diclina VS20]